MFYDIFELWKIAILRLIKAFKKPIKAGDPIYKKGKLIGFAMFDDNKKDIAIKGTMKFDFRPEKIKEKLNKIVLK